MKLKIKPEGPVPKTSIASKPEFEALLYLNTILGLDTSFIVKTVLYDQPGHSEHWSRGEHICYINNNIGTNYKVASTVTKKFQKAWSQHFEDQFGRGTGLYRFF